MPDTPKPGTPLPWRQDCELVIGDVPNGRPGGEVIVQCLPTVLRLLDRAIGIKNAAYIVHACNRLPELEAKLTSLEAERDKLAALEAENQRLREALSVTLSTIQSREDHYKFCIWCGDLTYPKHDCELMQMRDELAAALNTGEKK